MINTAFSNGIAVLSIDMPGRSMNVLTQELASALGQAFEAAVHDEAVRGIIITSGKRGFIAGADLSQMAPLAAPDVDEAEARQGIAVYGELFRRIETAGKPVVGAATGTALGGGLELLLATHYRIATDDSAARFGLPEVTLGLMPGAGGTQRLPRLVGINASLPLLVEGRSLDVAAAYGIGLINEVVPADRLLDAARTALTGGRVNPVAPWDLPGFRVPGGDAQTPENNLALSTAEAKATARSQGNHPAPAAIMRAVREGIELSLDEGLIRELDLFVPLLRGRTAQNMIRTLFFARQAADKLVRRPPNVPKSKVRKIGVLGAGFMGAGIAQVSALAGIEVVMVDRSLELASASLGAIAQAWEADVAKGRLSLSEKHVALQRISVAAGYEGFIGCDLVVEAVAEDQAIKADVIARTEAVLDSDAIFATNTSALPIDVLAVASVRPANFIGLHFFSPVPRMALVEVIVGKDTSQETLARSLDYVRQIRKTPIVVRDGYGFYTTRCVDAYYREGIRLLADGVDPARIERAGVALGMPVGPLALCDEIGMDVLQHIARFFRSREQGDWADDRHLQVNRVIDSVVAAQRFGRKKGAGFYAYPEGAQKHLDGSFLARIAVRSEDSAQPDQDSIGERLLYAQLLEAARCWAEGVVEDPSEIDLGAHLGWAFPSHLGGPAAAIDDIGADRFVARLQALAETLGPRFTPPAKLAAAAEGGFRFHT